METGHFLWYQAYTCIYFDIVKYNQVNNKSNILLGDYVLILFNDNGHCFCLRIVLDNIPSRGL